MVHGVCGPEVEGIILAGLGGFGLGLELAIHPNRMVHEPSAVPGKVSCGGVDALRLLPQLRCIVEIGGGGEGGGVKPVCRKIDARDEFVGAGPLDELPTGRILEQPVGVFECFKPLEEALDF